MITIFLLSADPRENRPLNLDLEFNQILEVYEPHKKEKEFLIEQLPAANYDNLLRVLMRDEASIIHFCGHGMGAEGLVFVDREGKKKLIDNETLTNLFKISQKNNQHINCLILNGCYTELQAEEISKYVKYVIGMTREVEDARAINFAKYFYMALFEKKDIEASFQYACISTGYSITLVEDAGLKRAVYDPSPNDQRASQFTFNSQIPQLIINSYVAEVYPQPNKIISDQQWNELESILSKISFDILKDACRDTFKKDVRDIEPKILSLKTLQDLKKLFLEQYPICKAQDSDNITILNFAARLYTEEEVFINQKVDIKNWLEKIIKEKNIDLLKLLAKTKTTEVSPDTILNSFLLISIIENTGIGSNFSLEAELIFDYQEENKNYKSTMIISRQEGINEVSPEEIESYISELISIAIDKLPPNHNLTIELFVPFGYLGETFELCKIPIPSRRTKKMKPLGSQYQFTVRCLDRYEDKQLFSNHTKRWIGIRQYLENNSSPLALEQKCDYLKSMNRVINWESLLTKWERGNFYAINVIDELPASTEEREEYFDYFLSSGVPISLWNRCSEVKCSVDGNSTIEQKFKELLNIEHFKDLNKIFKRIYQLRQDAHNTGDIAKNYLGYHLGFICDRPDPIPSNLRKRLNQRGLQGSN